MKHIIFFITIVCFTQFTFSQEVDSIQVNDSIDTKYREDQYYFGVSYNLLTNMPDGMFQNGFSSGFHLGFLRDMPINTRRNVAFAIGFGYSTSSINNNLLITQVQDHTYTYELLNDSQFTKNKFVQHLVEMPLEFRWRSSTASTYKFWRIYTGIKLGYVFASNTKFKNVSEKVKTNNIKDFNELQYGLTLAVGYDSWNIFMHYNLNTIFEDAAKLNSTTIDTKMLKIGIMFYIL